MYDIYLLSNYSREKVKYLYDFFKYKINYLKYIISIIIIYM